MIYNAVLVSSIWQSDSVVCIYVFFLIFLSIMSYYKTLRIVWASQVALVVKNPLTSAGDIRDVGLIPGSGRSPDGESGNPLPYIYSVITSLLAWKVQY